ncbi:flagellar filament capping protein FliD [Sphingosinicella terrae]|uniref:flagellar filament capping protein FliD n=1 Tax=Sphingosinicella terrae TaxID=2172047 RepID=UPI0025480896|nr:flagellar filament capping protein FliD [Sphingosinicella terrae]
MTTSIGYALGIGSGLDIKALVEDLAGAAKAPKEALIAKREQTNQARISALGEMSGAIDSFAAALSSLISGGSLFTQPSVSDSSIVSASSVAGTRLGVLSAEMEVVQLAKAQTLESAALAARTDAVGQGDLTLVTASGSFTITIGAGNDSLDGLAEAINAAGAGVQANVVVDTTGARLVLKGATGEANGFTLGAPGGTTSGLERFAFGPSVTGGMTQAQAAQDAILNLDGVVVKRRTNSFSDLVPGVQIDLKKAAPGTIVSLGITRPTGAISQAVGDFVAAFNELMGMIAETTAAGVNGAGGPLRGDLGVREMQRQLRELTAKELVHSGTGPRTLAEIGVKTNRDGTLSLDTARLETMLADDPEGVEALFNPTQYSSNPNVVISSAVGRAKPGIFTLTNLVAGPPASGLLDGQAMIASDNFLIAPPGSKAAGLLVRIDADTASATITVEPGLGGALQAIRDSLRASSGPFATTRDRLEEEAEDIADDRTVMETRADKYYNQLLNTFTAMERQVSAFKATQSYLEQQVKIWTNDRS